MTPTELPPKPPVEKQQQRLNKNEQQIIDMLTKFEGRELTEQEINLALDRALGEL
jgi:hypothetical protein